MPRLPGGDVLPSFLGIERTPTMWDGHNFDNTSLRIGEVQEIVYPNDPRSRTKRFTEYRVLVQQRSNRTGNSKIYESCLLMSQFGGVADRVSWTLRAATSQDKTGLGLGSKVLIACVNGETNVAYIIGGTRDQTDDSDVKVKDLKHHLLAVFNGVELAVDDDGQLTISYNGKTQADGTIDDGVDSNAPGTALVFGKDGSFTVGDKDAKNAFTIDHANSKVVIARDTAFELGAATDYMLLGESFRQSQSQMHAKLLAQLNTLQTLLITAGTALATTATTPVVPALPQPTLAPAGVALLAAADVAAQMAQAIQGFEQDAAQKNSFVSEHNKAD